MQCRRTAVEATLSHPAAAAAAAITWLNRAGRVQRRILVAAIRRVSCSAVGKHECVN